MAKTAHWQVVVVVVVLLLLLYYYYYSLRVFYTSISWWSFTGVWVTASLLKSTGLFSVFWPILAMLISKSSNPFINPLVTVPKATITIGIIVTLYDPHFFPFPFKVQVCILLFAFFQFYSDGLVWFLCLMAYQLSLGYLMPKPFS